MEIPHLLSAVAACTSKLRLDHMDILAEIEFLPIGKGRDLTGQKFGRLTALGIVEKRGKTSRAYWLCQCDCGDHITARGSHLVQGTPVDCGRHSVSATAKYQKLLHVWKSMKQRCENPNCDAWNDYGDRGITICDAWQDYNTFESWSLSHGYAEGLSIDRIDVNKGYSPENCRFADRKTQQQNRRVNHYATAWGETKCLEEWARDPRVKVSANTLRARLIKGMNPVDAMTVTALKHSEMEKYIIDLSQRIVSVL